MKTLQKHLFKLLLLAIASSVSVGSQADDKLEKIVAGKHRTESYAARDNYRNPVETLKFFGIKDNMTVVEISPGGGWYTEILAPYLKDNGTYIAAGYDPESKSDYYKRGALSYKKKLDANPELYGKVKLGIMEAPDKMDFAAPNSADMIVTFRNTHNWNSSGNAEVVFAAMFKALKPGGILGLVQHRAGHNFPKDTSGKMGYLRQDKVIEMAEAAGFRLIDKSDVNANPKDTRDHEAGVWTLPPVLRLKEKDKEKYMAIGESDRMTLKFVKPEAK
ncbi:MAG: methyltransferase [Gammaproteobacteria bacterium]|nr:methyltransferase [Gammaproteobacteria bacterium]